MNCISYKKGYKYQLTEDCCYPISIKREEHIENDFIILTEDGDLTMKKGYAWDGPSGPTFDTLNFMRGSLVHDALYQLMREGKLDQNQRKPADQLLREMCKEDGMSSIRALWVYVGLRIGGGKAADPANLKPITQAPKGCE